MWWLLFPHQGLSSSNWWASWVQRTANTLSATQNTSEMPQRHRLELCRVQGTEMTTCVPRPIPTPVKGLGAPIPGSGTHVNAGGVEGTVGRECQ